MMLMWTKKIPLSPCKHSHWDTWYQQVVGCSRDVSTRTYFAVSSKFASLVDVLWHLWISPASYKLFFFFFRTRDIIRSAFSMQKCEYSLKHHLGEFECFSGEQAVRWRRPALPAELVYETLCSRYSRAAESETCLLCTHNQATLKCDGSTFCLPLPFFYFCRAILLKHTLNRGGVQCLIKAEPHCNDLHTAGN